MTATAVSAGSTRARTPGPLGKVVRLHFVDASRMFTVPLIIFGGAIAVGVVIMLLIRALVPGAGPEVSEGFRHNQAALWCFAGYFMNIGIMAYARTMPYAIGLGATRRQYWAGTGLALLAEALFLAVVMVLLLAIERATGHWFTGARMFDVYVVGDGNYADLFLMGFGIAFASLFVGSGFASVYLRWGQRGVLAVVAGIVAALLLALAAVMGIGPDLLNVFGAFAFWKVATALMGIGAVAAAGSWLVLRRAPIGR
jgi:hypothetical protein